MSNTQLLKLYKIISRCGQRDGQPQPSAHHVTGRLKNISEPRHEISNNVVCATSKALDQPAHTRSLTRSFASRLNII